MVAIFNRFKPMKCRDAERALLNLGFEERRRKGTSHRQFVKVADGHMRKATLDCHKGEVAAKDVRSMIGQAGVSRREFYAAAGLIKDGTVPSPAAGETD